MVNIYWDDYKTNNMMSVTKYFKWEYLLLPLIIYVSDDTVLFGTNNNEIYIYVKYAILLCVFALLFFKSYAFIHTKQFRCCIFMSMIIMFSSILNNDLRLGLVYKCLLLLLSCIYASQTKIQRFASLFVDFIYVIALISVVCTLVMMVNPSFFSFAPSIENTANTPFVNLFLYVAPSITTINVRNYGIFREPGVYQMYLIMSLVLMIYYVSVFKMKRFIIITLALALTLSTTGYIAYVCVIALFIVNRNKITITKKQRNTVFVLFIMCLFLLFTQTNLLSSDGIIFDKFSNTDRHTTIARMSSLTTNVKIWLQNPMFGAGLQNVNDSFEVITLRDYGFASPHNTNTFLCELATFGVFYFLLFIVGMFKYSRLFGISFIEHLLVFIILFTLSIGEKLTFSPFFYIMMFYGYRYNNEHECRTL